MSLSYQQVTHLLLLLFLDSESPEQQHRESLSPLGQLNENRTRGIRQGAAIKKDQDGTFALHNFVM